MKNNNLIPYKESLYTKIIKFLKEIFIKKEKCIEEENEYININQVQEESEIFNDRIIIKEDEEEKRLKMLQLQYDNGEIDEDDLSEEDINKLIAWYDQETKQIENDTKRRKERIEKMLNELKNLQYSQRKG